MASSSRPILLRARGIRKRYAAPVLTDLDLDLHAGEVHALVGANGAGKSTLCRIICGLVQPDGGELELAGAPYHPRSRNAAEREGVQMVMQELNLIPTLTVAENLFLNRLPHRLGFVRRSELYAQARRALEAVGLGALDPGLPVERLGVGQQQLVEIAASLARSCRVLILDEPTAALTESEAELLFAHIERLKRRGVGILYISHRMEEVRRIADTITVLRDGRIVVTDAPAALSPDEIVRQMAGRDVEEQAEQASYRQRGKALRVAGLRRGPLVRDVSFDVTRGEILGFAGLIGSGRTETMRAIFGADRPEAGEIYVADSNEPVDIGQPRDAVRAGIGLVPEDRKQQGLLLPLSVRENITLGKLGAFRGKLGWIDARQERAWSEVERENLDVQCASLDQPVIELSGGNQQKVVIGRWLLRDCEVLLFDEPTRGIDVAAKQSVYRLIRELAGEGKGIVVVSSELPELMLLCDRIAVMSAGKLVTTFERGAWTQEAILEAALREYSATTSTGKVAHV
ncbi:MAG TPA: sugar ABC transporter ATP-binding protein [Rhodothermales bacterium]|nr:sugar ABC transporter ATP-binding protein [Rhodothermales bacterium]